MSSSSLTASFMSSVSGPMVWPMLSVCSVYTCVKASFFSKSIIVYHELKQECFNILVFLLAHYLNHQNNNYFSLTSLLKDINYSKIRLINPIKYKNTSLILCQITFCTSPAPNHTHSWTFQAHCRYLFWIFQLRWSSRSARRCQAAPHHRGRHTYSRGTKRPSDLPSSQWSTRVQNSTTVIIINELLFLLWWHWRNDVLSMILFEFRSLSSR